MITPTASRYLVWLLALGLAFLWTCPVSAQDEGPAPELPESEEEGFLPETEAPEPETEAPEPEAEAPEPQAEAPEPQAEQQPVDPMALPDGPERWFAQGRQAREQGDSKAAGAKFIAVFKWRDDDGNYHPLADEALHNIASILAAEPLKAFSPDEVQRKRAASNWELAARFFLAATKVDPNTTTDAFIRHGEMLARLERLDEAIAALESAARTAPRLEHRARARAIVEGLRRGEALEAAIAAGLAAETAARLATQPEPAVPGPARADAEPLIGEVPPELGAAGEPAETGTAVAETAGGTVPEAAVEIDIEADTEAETTLEPEEAPATMVVDTRETHVVSCHRTREVFYIDGRINERGWAAAVPIALDAFPWHNPLFGARQRTEVRILYDQKFLYVAIQARDRDISGEAIGRDNKDIAADERVEVYLQVDPNGEEYYCFEVNSKGALLDYRARVSRQFQVDWNCNGAFVAARARHADGSYAVEMAIPLLELIGGDEELLPRPGDRWRVGFYRIDKNLRSRRGARQLYAMWKPSGTRRPDFHKLASLGRLQFKGMPLARRR